MPAWTESAASRTGSLEIVVDAIDVVRTEKYEMEKFRDALAAPSVEKSVELTDQRGQKYSSGDALAMVKGIVFLFVAIVFAYLVAGLASVFDLRLDGVVLLGLVVSAVAATAGFLAFRSRSSRRSTTVPKVRDRFTVTLDHAGLVVAGTDTRRTYALETIETFEGGRRLVVVSKDGGRAELPLALASLPENQALAARLNDALVEARAAGGYRGRGPRVDVGAVEEEPAPSEEQERQAATRSSDR